MAANPYKKIGSGGRLKRSRYASISLWRGPDHLLQIERDHYQERYKRFYFADIQSITVCRNQRRRNYNIFFGSMLLLATAGFAFPAIEVRILSGIVWWIFFIPFVWNSLLGPTCITYITTAVQEEELPALRRVRKTQRVLEGVRASIAVSQGMLSAQALQERFGVPAAVAAPLPKEPLNPPDEPG